MSKEEWRDVVGHEGIYKVSNLGRVKSLSRVIERSNGRKQTFKSRVLKPALEGKGYLMVILSNKGVKRNAKLHHLVVESFLGYKKISRKIVVDHIDNNKLNNKLSNLQIITQRLNTSKNKTGSSKYTGVHWCNTNKKFRASIYLNGKNKTLGYSKCEIEAYKIYQSKLEEYEETYK